MKTLLLTLLLVAAASAQTTIINGSKTCVGPSQSASCSVPVLSGGTGSVSFTFGTPSIYNQLGNSVTIGGVVYTDITWVKTQTGDNNYIFTGTFNNGLDSISETMHLACRAGRGGGCTWTDLGGTIVQ
jgi:hypothetical protein